MHKTLTEEEIEFMEAFSDPVALTECLIPENIKAPHVWGVDCKKVTLRPYQFATQDYSYMYADDPKLTDQQNYQNKIGAGELFYIGARNLGKSFGEVINNFLTLIHTDGYESLVASCDYGHLKKICTPIVNLSKYHPFFKIFKRRGYAGGTLAAGGMEIESLLGHTMYGKNENISDPDPGVAFHSVHPIKTTYEEYSYSTTKGYDKRIDSVHTIGCIERVGGIPDIRRGSPLGDIIHDKSKRPWICQLPQLVMEDWSEHMKQKRIKKYKGENSLSYKLNVLAEPTEGAFGRWDMERVKKMSYVPSKKIKYFEISKKLFEHLDEYLEDRIIYEEKFRDILDINIVIDKIPSDLKIIASDIGTTASPSEICVFFGDNKLLKWRYNIPLFQLTTQQQALVFKWIYDRIDGAFIALDATAADGRAIADELNILGVPEKNITRCIMNEKITVGFRKNKEGKVIEDEKTKEPIKREEITIDWSCSELEKLFYNGLIEIPHDDKFLEQFPAYFAVKTGRGYKYGTSSEDHLVQSFQCMSICRFFNVGEKIEEETPKPLFAGGF